MAKKLSASAERALSVIAHVAMARNMEKEIPGFEGFGEYYRKELSPADRAIYARFNDLCRQAHRDLAKLLEKDLEKSDG